MNACIDFVESIKTVPETALLNLHYTDFEELLKVVEPAGYISRRLEEIMQKASGILSGYNREFGLVFYKYKQTTNIKYFPKRYESQLNIPKYDWNDVKNSNNKVSNANLCSWLYGR